jgi:ABC-2 type transport system ATP-binding protein
MTTTPIVALKNLCKHFGHTVALQGINLTIDRPCIFGVVGPDGAGKTTLLRSLVGLLEFEAEQAEVLGYDIVRDPYRLRERLGYVPQAFGLYTELTVLQNLQFFADVHGIARKTFWQRTEELLAIARLENFRTAAVSALSGGMKQKLAIICALIHRPHILILDEPNNGVDVIARAEVWDILRHLEDVAVVISTGYLDEADRCDELLYLYAGRIRVQGTPAAVRARYPYHAYRILDSDLDTPRLQESGSAWLIRARISHGNGLLETTLATSTEVRAALARLGAREVWIEPAPPTLEMVFTHLTHEAQTHG